MSLHQKAPLSRTLSRFAKRKTLDEIAELGLGLPGHVVSVNGAIVTVEFDVLDATLEQVTMPIAGSLYVRIPVQVGDLGVAVPCDAYLGGVSGLGGGTADLTRRGNLSTLMWVPIGNSGWSSVNASYVVAQGPNGVQLQDLAGVVTATFDKNSGASVQYGGGSFIMNNTQVSLSFGGKSIVINASGITIDGIPWDSHKHPGVTSGPSITGGPQA